MADFLLLRVKTLDTPLDCQWFGRETQAPNGVLVRTGGGAVRDSSTASMGGGGKGRHSDFHGIISSSPLTIIRTYVATYAIT